MERTNAIAFRVNPDLPFLLSPGYGDEEAGGATKAAIFRVRTIQQKRQINDIKTPKNDLLKSFYLRRY